MNTTEEVQPSNTAKKALASLQKAVTQALDVKRKMGHYSVTWDDGNIVLVGDDAPKL